MSKSAVTQPQAVRETIYLHVRPTLNWQGNRVDGLHVAKMAKSTDAQVTPGDSIIKLEVVAPAHFFDNVIPTSTIELQASDTLGFISRQMPAGYVDIDTPEPEDA